MPTTPIRETLMFIHIATDTETETLINLNFALSIILQPYESGYQLVADFPNNCKPLKHVAPERERVVILRGPCTKEYADIQRNKLLAQSPEYDRFARSVDGVCFDLHDIASVVKWYDDRKCAFRVTAYFASDVRKSPSDRASVDLECPSSKCVANEVLGVFAIKCSAIRLEFD